MKVRDEIKLNDKWDVETLYPNFKAWNQDFLSAVESEAAPHWPSLNDLRGTLSDGPNSLLAALDLILGTHRKLSKLYTYAHLRHDEDIADPEAKSAQARIMTALSQFDQEASWFEPELLSLPKETLENYIAADALSSYRQHLTRIISLKEHTLPPEQERLLALSSQALWSSYKTFNALSDADFSFGTVEDSKGRSHPLSHGTFGVLLRSPDRTLRMNTFKTKHKKYNSYKNTFGELLSGQVQTDLFQARARNYSTCVESALKPNGVPVSVYRSLIDAVNSRLPSLHRYMRLRKKLLKVSELHLYDMFAPVVSEVEIKMNFETASNSIIESVAPLGAEYQETLSKGLNQARWVDRYENQNKRSGAYSSGCYDSNPYILMNYQGILNDVFTLAHEAGHSMHSYLSRQNQPYHDASYTIFVAEVASTFNEQLLTKVLRERFPGKEEQMYLINHQLEDIRSTLFRQTMFAEFELRIHELAEGNVPLTPELLSEEYMTLNHKYFGKDVVIDPESAVEWARIPHFYYNFYVYQYATGVSAALALFKKVMSEGTTARDAYLAFLSGGSSKFPIDLLKGAGVNMESKQPVLDAIDIFDDLLGELENLSDLTKN